MTTAQFCIGHLMYKKSNYIIVLYSTETNKEQPSMLLNLLYSLLIRNGNHCCWNNVQEDFVWFKSSFYYNFFLVSCKKSMYWNKEILSVI
jgi:hypothetical protein